MIQTNPFEITKATYFKIVMILRLRAGWAFYLLLIIIAFIAFYTRENPVSLLLFIFSIIFFPVLVFTIYKFTYSELNNYLLSSRYLIVDAKKISERFKDPANPEDIIISEYPISAINRKLRFNSYWLLRLGQGNYIIISISSFASEADKEEFEKIIERIPAAGTVQ